MLLYYEGYFNNFDLIWKSIYLLPCMVTVDTKLKVFQYKILNNILFANKMLFKLNKVVSLLCSFCKAEDKTYIHYSTQLTYLLFFRCKKTSILWKKNFRILLSISLDLPSILPQSVIFGFLVSWVVT